MKRNYKGGDLVGWMQKFNPPEMHLPGYQYCGPFTKLEKRLARGDLGINRVDEACKKHDIAYSKTKETALRHIADQELLNDLSQIENPTFSEKIASAIIKPIIKTKKRFGLGNSYINTDIYCLKCKTKTPTKNLKEEISKNNKFMIKGVCSICNTKKACFKGTKKNLWKN